jgi:DNA repair exonuclease SbcCD nuclease subunit
LQNFHAKGESRYQVGVLHGDPMLLNSPYCPITAEQVRQSGLDYLALGHIHRRGSFRAGRTTCAWPGCPMGRGYDEQGQKGVYLITVEDRVRVEFISLDMPQFHDLTVEVTGDPVAALEAVLPAAGSRDYFRVTLTGVGDDVDMPALRAAFSRFPNLKLRDQTAPALDVWARAGEDTLEGVYFRLLRDTMEGQDERAQHLIKEAAEISRKLMNGQEVVLP